MFFRAPEENALFDSADAGLTLKNPLGKDFSVMKNSLLAGLLKNTALNANQDMERVALFEIGNAFGQSQGRIREEKILAISAYGLQQKKDWRCREASIRFFLFQVPAGPARQAPAPGIRFQKTRRTRRMPMPAVSPSRSTAVRCGLCGEVKTGVLPLLQAGQAGIRGRDRPAASCSPGRGKTVFKCGTASRLSRRDFTFLMAKTVSYEELQRLPRAFAARGP